MTLHFSPCWKLVDSTKNYLTQIKRNQKGFWLYKKNSWIDIVFLLNWKIGTNWRDVNFVNYSRLHLPVSPESTRRIPSLVYAKVSDKPLIIPDIQCVLIRLSLYRFTPSHREDKPGCVCHLVITLRVTRFALNFLRIPFKFTFSILIKSCVFSFAIN